MASGLASTGADNKGSTMYLQDHPHDSTLRNAAILCSAALAQKVFNIKELMEAILLSLGEEDILNAQFACRNMQVTIAESKALQKSLFRLPDPDANFRIHECLKRDRNSSEVPLVYVDTGTMKREDNTVSFAVMIDDIPKFAASNVGSASRNTHICQPPVTALETYKFDGNPVHPEAIGGLTLGDLQDICVAEVAEGSETVFVAHVQLKANDPFWETYTWKARKDPHRARVDIWGFPKREQRTDY